MAKHKLVKVLFAAFIMSIMVMSGCGTKKESETSGSKENGEKPYEITMAYIASSNIEDVENVQEEINKITREKINANVTLLPISGGAWTQQTNLMLTGTEKLDLIVSSSFYNYGSQAVKGQLLPLDELLESHGKGILKEMPEHMINATKIDGKIYGVPSVRDWASDHGFIMRKDLVDKYNIDLSKVKTIEDMGEIFKIIKDNEPGVDPIVNTGDLLSTVETYIYPHFDRLGDNIGVLEMKEDNWKVENLYEHPIYKDAVNLAREWYKADYIIKDAATSDEVGYNIVKSGKGFGYFTNMKPGLETQETIRSGREMVAVRVTAPYQFTTSATSFMMSLAKNSENPEKAMDFMNLLYTDADIMNLLTLGIEDKHYELNEEEFAVQLEEGSKYVFNQWLIGNNFLTHIWEGNDKEYWEELSVFNESAEISPAFGFSFNATPVKTEIAATANVLEQYRKGLETGTLDPEKALPEFNKKLKAAGSDKILEEKQKQLDEWRKNQ
ncbi:ABC transporter substrate-binding protein [Lederbergia lenta]|uniref:Solute-binding family protein 1 n=1 Tax=Lederbergia lenta TaxID=1467 RepID=A0A2X4WHU7_LEDLE|nr:ABC transporter substrate-binding protein [Lederbergia lenta]MEC2326191.1 ABC transporter substrate-binding protein [Lederbergia lenta]SQI63626.1 solute-binding family protein 1 [Lederbergia lenta]